MLGPVAVGLYSFTVAYILGKIIDKTIGFRLPEEEEITGIDALVGESDHGLTKSLYATDPSTNELEVMWDVPLEDREAELARASAPTAPLDWERTLARWDPQLKTGIAAITPA